MKVQSLENIPNKVLDRIVELYSNDDNFRVIDERELLRCGEKKEYFLFAKDKNFGDLQWCFIWISNNISQRLCKYLRLKGVVFYPLLCTTDLIKN